MPEGIAVNRSINPVDICSRVRSYIYRENESLDDLVGHCDRVVCGDRIALPATIVAG